MQGAAMPRHNLSGVKGQHFQSLIIIFFFSFGGCASWQQKSAGVQYHNYI